MTIFGWIRTIWSNPERFGSDRIRNTAAQAQQHFIWGQDTTSNMNCTRLYSFYNYRLVPSWLIDWGKNFSFPGGAGRACWVDGADPVPRGGEEPADGLAAHPQPPLSPHLWCEPQSAHRPWHRLLVHCLQILKVSVHLTIYSIFNYFHKISVAEPVRF